MDIELIGVGKRYGAQHALRDVNLIVPHGQRVALVGPNGSGKSTLLRALMGLVAVDGTVLLDGMSPFTDRGAINGRLAYVPQIAPQLGATVSEVVRTVATLRGLDPARAGAVAGELGLDVAAVARKPFRQLSGGMKQKLLLALALASRAKLLILDEPTASLDAAARDRFVALLDEAARDATVILCSHRLEEVQRLTERVIELGEGRVVRDLRAVKRDTAAPPPLRFVRVGGES